MTKLEILEQDKDNVIKLYDSLSMKDIAIKYGVHSQDVSYFLKINNIPKKKRVFHKWTESQRKNLINSYKNKTDEEKAAIKQKRAATNLSRYGTSTNLQTKEAIQNRINKFGSNSPLSKSEIKEKMLKNNASKHNGQSNPYQWEETKKKIKATVQDRYGVDYIGQSEEQKEKSKETCLERYGTDSYMKTEEFKERSKKACLERYGAQYYAQSTQYKDRFLDKSYVKAIQEKTYNTKKLHNSFKVSYVEDKIYEMLITVYPNTVRQYKSEKYPFNCDFYIPEKDLYIEYQGNWTHGDKPYDENDIDCINLVNLWTKKTEELNARNKQKLYYKNAIHTYIILDPQKRKTAKDNKLNWIEFFSIKEFEDWFSDESLH